MIVVRSPDGRHLETLGEARTPLRLASDLAATCTLGPAAFERTAECLEDFLAQARSGGAARMVAVATAAVRDATNGEEFIERVRRRTKIDIEVIDGDREAALAFMGAVHSLPVESGMLLDVGGGSIELSRFKDRAMQKAWTLPLGSLLLTDRFLAEDPPARGERRRLIEHISETLEEATVPSLPRGGRLVGTGGTIRNLAKMDRRERSYPLTRLHGYILSIGRIEELATLLSSRPLAKRTQLSGLNPDRADSIVGGAIVVRTIMDAIGADEVTVSGKGLREGLAMEALGNEMPSPDVVRHASLESLAGRFGSWDRGRAERRSALATELFETVAPDREPDAAEMLRHAATIIDVGATIDAYNRHEHAASTILTGDLSGYSHPQLALIAAILRRADKEDAGLKPYRSLLRSYDPATLTRAAVSLAVADEIDLRLPAGTSVSLRTTKSTISAVGPLTPGRWSELLSSRARVVLGRGFAVKTREDEP
jgi:exopolyphosphatase/guanosine-5'-triphosphate,3'-diphosphate pyrophosphatase